jgi:hypothetical protein
MKKVLFIFLAFIIIIFSFFVFFIETKKTSVTPSPISTPTPLTLPINTNKTGLSIVSTLPANNATNINANQPIIITFNRTVSSSDFSFALAPNLPYTSSFQGNQFIVTPTNSFDTGTPYYFTIQFSDGIFAQKFSFVTAGAGPIGNSSFDNVSEVNNAGYKILKPDLFLSNQTPYQTSDFSVNYHLSQTPTDHFAFEVTLTGPNKLQSKQDFLTWLHSLGLTDDEIQQIDITYL